MTKGYPTNLTDNQWQILQKNLEPTTRKRKYLLRDIMDCILYINKTGYRWRMIPKDFPPYNLVFYYFTKWKREGVFEDIMDTLHEKFRIALGREESPSVSIIDSRSAKATDMWTRSAASMATRRKKGGKIGLWLTCWGSRWPSPSTRRTSTTAKELNRR